MTLSAQLECFYSSYIVPGIKQMEETAKKKTWKETDVSARRKFSRKKK
jgi:hypothetical protein